MSVPTWREDAAAGIALLRSAAAKAPTKRPPAFLRYAADYAEQALRPPRAPRPGSLRANVLDCIRSWPGIEPREIAAELGQNADSVRYALYQLRKRKLAPPARAEGGA